MGHAAPISLDRFRRRSRREHAEPTFMDSVAARHPLTGCVVAMVEQRFGLMVSREDVRITDVVAVSGDLAVADRLAFVDASRRRCATLVVECDGWYLAVDVDRALDPADLAALRPPTSSGAPRIMSLATSRGVVPVMTPFTDVPLRETRLN